MNMEKFVHIVDKNTHELTEFDILGPHTERSVVRAFELAVQNECIGDYLEFGVYMGHSLSVAYQQIQGELGKTDKSSSCRIFGFDSFQGLPTITDIDKGDPFFFEGNFACSEFSVRELLKCHQIPESGVTLVPGWYSETLTSTLASELGIERCRIALIDCDLYESTKPVLDFLAPLIAEQAILVFDDWGHFEWENDLGQRKAFREFLEEFPDIKVVATEDFGYGKLFLVERSSGVNK
jgi:hypothetical protein